MVLTELASGEIYRADLMGTDQKVNASALARALKVSQPTISRALANPRYQPKKDLVDKVAGYFGISAAQARGEESLMPAPSDADKITVRARNFAKRYDRLEPAQKKVLDDMLGLIEAQRASQQHVA